MAIFIVFAGTLAQTEKDIWQVIHDYFRMDLAVAVRGRCDPLWPGSISAFSSRVRSFPNMEPIPWGYGFWFPSGWLIGFVLFLNLTAAHLIRFRIQGKRQVAGRRPGHSRGRYPVGDRRDRGRFAADGQSVAALHRLAFAAHSLAADPVHGGECRAVDWQRI